MPVLTRRRALLAVASGAAALAGCPGGSGDEPPTVDRETNGVPIDDYEVARARTDGETALFADRARSTDADDRRERPRIRHRQVVLSESDLAETTFAETPEGDRLGSFAAATQFDSASLYLLSMPVGACHEVRLQSVTVEADDLADDDLHPHANFCSEYRPADVACDEGERDAVWFVVRLPVAAERSTGHGRGISSSCHPDPEGAQFDATVTPAEEGDDS